MSGIGIVFPMGQSRKLLETHGQWDVWEQELKIFRKHFQPVVLLEYQYVDLRRFIEATTFVWRKKQDLNRCDLLFGVHLSGALLCLLTKVRFGIPYVFSYAYDYAEFAWKEKKWLQWLFVKFFSQLILRHADIVVVPTETLKQQVESSGTRRSVVIPNSVDTRLFSPALKGQTLRTQGLTFNPSTILSVGRLEPQKNQFALIDAVFQLQKHRLFKEVKLVVVGQGSLEGELKRRAAQFGVPLTIHQSIPHEQLPSVFRSATIFVLPSLFEGHPKALLEAMSCGLPVVASRIPGCTDIVTDGYDGLLVEATANRLQRGLERIFRDQKFANRLGQHARKTIVSRFDKKKLMEKEIKLLRNLIRDR